MSPEFSPLVDAELRLRKELEDRGYELEGCLGRGGKSIVWAARWVRGGLPVAVKVFLAGGADYFQAEVDALGTIGEHESIVRLLDRAPGDPKDDGPPGRLWYVVTERGERDLAQELETRRNLPPSEAAGVALRLAQALDRTHQKGRLHRDIKPGNVFLVSGVWKLGDFSLAGHDDPDGYSPNFAHPEQVATFKAARGASGRQKDLYGLGATLYSMLTGRTVRPWRSRRRLLPPAPSRRNPDVPEALDRICSACLHPDPRYAFRKAEEAEEALTCFLESGDVSTPVEPRKSRFLRVVRAHAPVVSTLLAVACLLGIQALRDAREHGRIASHIEVFLRRVDPLVANARGGPKEGISAWEEAGKLLAQARSLLERVPDRIDLVRRCDDLGRIIEFGRSDARKALASIENDRLMIGRLESARLAPAVTFKAGFDYATGDRMYDDAFTTYLGQDLLKSPHPQEVVAPLLASPLRKQLAGGFAEWMVIHMETALTSGSGRAIMRATGECQILREAALRLGTAGDKWEQRFYRAFGSPLAVFQLRRLARETEFDSTPTAQLTLLGEILIDQNLDEAIPFLRRAQEIHPRDLWINYFLTIALLSKAEELNKLAKGQEEVRKHMQLAHRFAERAEVLAPDDPTLRTLLGAVLAETGQHPEAINEWRRILKKWPEAVHARANLVRALVVSGDLEGAKAEIDSAPDRIRREPLHRLILADWYLASGRPQDALFHYRDILKPGSGFDPWEYLNFGRALLLVGDMQGARSALLIAQPKWPAEAGKLLKQCEENKAIGSSRTGSGGK